MVSGWPRQRLRPWLLGLLAVALLASPSSLVQVQAWFPGERIIAGARNTSPGPERPILPEEAASCFVSNDPFKPSKQWPPKSLSKEACPKNKWVMGCYLQAWMIDEDNADKYPGYKIGSTVYLGGCKAAAIDDEELLTTNEKLSHPERFCYQQSVSSERYGNKRDMTTCLCQVTDCNIPTMDEVPGWTPPDNLEETLKKSTVTINHDDDDTATVMPSPKGGWKRHIQPYVEMAVPGLLASYGFSSLSIGVHQTYLLFSNIHFHIMTNKDEYV